MSRIALILEGIRWVSRAPRRGAEYHSIAAIWLIYTDWRAPTSGLEPLTSSLGVIHEALQVCAGDRKCRMFRGVSFPCLAACCTVLCSRWYQSGINQ